MMKKKTAGTLAKSTLRSLRLNMDAMASQTFQYLTVQRHDGKIFVITLARGDENKLTAPFCQEIIRAYNNIQRALIGTDGGAVITRGSNNKFWCTGVELEDPDPWMSADGFYPVSSLKSTFYKYNHIAD
jgi:enoyl-CoA hydratase/carnithine racemase